MIEQVKAGDKLTIIKVNSFAATSISEIIVDSIIEGRIIFAHKRKRYYLNFDNGTLVLKGHNLGITQGSWGNGCCFLMSGNCNIGGLDSETMKTLLKTNINETFNNGSVFIGSMEPVKKETPYSCLAQYRTTI